MSGRRSAAASSPTASAAKPTSFSAKGGGASKKGGSAKPAVKAKPGPQLSVERKIPVTLEQFEASEQYKTQFFDERIRSEKSRIFYILDHNTDKAASKSEFIRFNKFKFVRVKAQSHVKPGAFGLYFGYQITKEAFEFLSITRHNIIGQFVIENPHIFFGATYIKKVLETLLASGKPFIEWTEDERKKVFEDNFKWRAIVNEETGETQYFIYLSIEKSKVTDLEEYPNIKIGKSVPHPTIPGKFIVEPLYHCPPSLSDFSEPTQRVKDEHEQLVAAFQEKFPTANDALEDDCMKLWSSLVNVIPKELGLVNQTDSKPLSYSWRLEEIIIIKKAELSGRNGQMGADFDNDDLEVEADEEETVVAAVAEGGETEDQLGDASAAGEDTTVVE